MKPGFPLWKTSSICFRIRMTDWVSISEIKLYMVKINSQWCLDSTNILLHGGRREISWLNGRLITFVSKVNHLRTLVSTVTTKTLQTSQRDFHWLPSLTFIPRLLFFQFLNCFTRKNESQHKYKKLNLDFLYNDTFCPKNQGLIN